MDALGNFAYSTVLTAPSPATTGTTLVVQSGDGAKFPATPFDLTMWPANTAPTSLNAEIARCTNVSTDTLTITRHQYGTTAQSVTTGYQVAQNITGNLLGQLMPLSTYDPASIAQQVVGTSATQTLTNKRVTKRVLTITSNTATPSINTDSYDVVEITGQSVTIASFTTNLTGTPSNGDMLVIAITGTAAVSLTWGAKFVASTIPVPTSTVTTARLNTLWMYSTVATAWICLGAV